LPKSDVFSFSLYNYYGEDAPIWQTSEKQIKNFSFLPLIQLGHRV